MTDFIDTIKIIHNSGGFMDPVITFYKYGNFYRCNESALYQKNMPVLKPTSRREIYKLVDSDKLEVSVEDLKKTIDETHFKYQKFEDLIRKVLDPEKHFLIKIVIDECSGFRELEHKAYTSHAHFDLDVILEHVFESLEHLKAGHAVTAHAEFFIKNQAEPADTTEKIRIL